MKKQTAIEWLMENLHIAKDPFGQAKQMEKKQIIDAWKDGSVPDMDLMAYAERYYNETYGK